MTSQQLGNERLQHESDLTFRMDTLYIIPNSKAHFDSCSNKTCDTKVQFEVWVSIILRHAIENMTEQQGGKIYHKSLK